MDWRSVEARNRTDARPLPPTPGPARRGRPRGDSTGRRLLLPVTAAVVGLGVVVGAALAGPWQAAPRDPVQVPTPTAPVTEGGEEVIDLVPPPEAPADDGGFPLMLWIVIAALLLLLLVLRAFLNRATLARGRDEGSYEAASGRTGQVEPLATEPDLPALRRGVAAARRVLDDHPDPDDAVIAAWLELERAAASSGVERKPSDTPTELTTAVLDATRADPLATRTLLGLYHRARFAPHAVLGAPEVAQAADSLERIAASWEER